MHKLILTGLAGLALLSTAPAQTDLGPLNLPAGVASLPFDEDFEAAAGVVPGYMALTAIDVATLLPDAEAWANIGNLAACTNPFDGAYNLELGLIPGSTNYHDVRNAMVLGFDATGYTGDMTMSAVVIDGGEEFDTVDGVWVSDNGTDWYAISSDWGSFIVPDNAWTNSDAMDMTSTAADVSGVFYVAFVQEDNFPYLDLDGIGVDGIHAPAQLVGSDLGPLNLPLGFLTPPFTENFEAAAGVVPGYMALTELDAITLLPDPTAWANIGNRAPCLNPFSGSYALEMGVMPGGSSHNVRNAMVLGIDPIGYTGAMTLSYMGYDDGEETHGVDGLWVSNDGILWFNVADYNDLVIDNWTHSGEIDLSLTPVDVNSAFYMAIVQEDNSPYLSLDGIGGDDFNVPAVPAPPILENTGLTGGLFTTMTVNSGYANKVCKFLASTTGGGPTTVLGVTLDLSNPILQLADVASDANGTAIYSTIVPAGASGLSVWLQAVMLADGTGIVSNSIADVIL